MNNYQHYIALSRYARYIPEENRRETWEETVNRYIEFFAEQLGENWQDSKGIDASDVLDTLVDIEKAIINLEVMPSMRCLMTAGKALDRDNVAGYNCSYLVVDHQRAFDELMYILMCGTGVGFSVERQYITKLPEVSEEMHPTDTTIVVADSKIGWASALRELITLLYAGKIPSWDVSKVRPSGAQLKTFGGRASGPEPLLELFQFTVDVFTKAAGRKLTSLECHDLCCKIADVVVVGGVRRSALISLSNVSDDRMRSAKSGQWFNENPQRALANNSACYTETPDLNVFLDEMSSLYDSKSGERGFFSRVASQKQAERNGRRDSEQDFGTNPCSEIILRPNQFCNLTEVVVRPEDTLDDLKRKVEYATILGTIQSTLTDFRYLRKIWKTNTEEERLLGVSLTGIMDHPVLNGKSDPFYADVLIPFGMSKSTSLENILEELRDVAVKTNKEWAAKLGIPQSTAITCVKPSGTVSQLVDSASGIHPRYSPYYIRRVRSDVKDPLTTWMIEQGFPYEQDRFNASNIIFSFPMKSPEGAVHTEDVGAMGQLKLWDIYQKHWCEHKPSITVYYDDKEFLEAMSWLYSNFDEVSGISFLPKNDHIYPQAPYEEITEEQYNEMLKLMPDEAVWDTMELLETEDNVEGVQSLACTGNSCEI
jgi:ribonucleoside-diphosphate reductase alpha chain